MVDLLGVHIESTDVLMIFNKMNQLFCCAVLPLMYHWLNASVPKP